MIDINDDYFLNPAFARPRRKLQIMVSQDNLLRQIDVMRTVYWSHGLMLRIDAQSGYALQKVLEPQSFRKNADGITIHNGKWLTYLKGRHVPRESLIQRVESLFLGSAREINHVLWQVLKSKTPISPYANNWLRQLNADVQNILFCSADYEALSSPARKNIDNRMLLLLLRRTSIDGLAAMTILTLEAMERNQTEQAFQYGRYLYQMLLILGMELKKRGMSYELLEWYSGFIFPKIVCHGWRYNPSTHELVNDSCLLNLAVSWVKDAKNQSLKWSERVGFMAKLLKGHYGFDVKDALIPAVAPLTWTAENIKKHLHEERKKRWAWEMVFKGEYQTYGHHPIPDGWMPAY